MYNNKSNNNNLNLTSYKLAVLLLCFSFLIYNYVLQVSPSVMTNQLIRTFKLNGLALGNLATAYFYTYILVQLFAGPLLDKYSPKIITSLDISIMSIGVIEFSQSSIKIEAIFWRAFIGIGAAFTTLSYMKIIGDMFQKQFAFFSGLLATGAMLGSILGQKPILKLIELFDWRDTLFYIGIAGIILAITFFLIVRYNNNNNNIKIHHHNKISIKAIKKMLKNKYNWYLMLYSGCIFTPIPVFGGLWGVPFLEAHYHFDISHAASLTSTIFLGLAIGGPIIGLINLKYNKTYEIMMFNLFISLLSLIILIYIDNLSYLLLLIFSFLLGFSVSVFMLGFVIGRNINPIFLSATVIAFINTGDAIFGAFTEPTLGKLLDIFNKNAISAADFSIHDYKISFMILPVYAILSMIFLYKLKPCLVVKK